MSLFFETYYSDIDFWKQILSAYTPRSILEIGGGSGRLPLNLLCDYRSCAWTLHERDFWLAKEGVWRTKRAGHKVNYVLGDFLSYNGRSQRFDAVIAPFNVVNEVQDLATFVSCATQRLKVGGIFVVKPIVHQKNLRHRRLTRNTRLNGSKEESDFTFTSVRRFLNSQFVCLYNQIGTQRQSVRWRRTIHSEKDIIDIARRQRLKKIRFSHLSGHLVFRRVSLHKKPERRPDRLLLASH